MFLKVLMTIVDMRSVPGTVVDQVIFYRTYWQPFESNPLTRRCRIYVPSNAFTTTNHEAFQTTYNINSLNFLRLF